MKLILMLGAILPAIVFPPMTMAHGASSVPVLDVKTTCSDAEAVTGEAPRAGRTRGATAADRRTYNACMADEKQAQSELTNKWKSFKPSDQASCVQAGAAPNPSYVELLTCLEMSTPTFSGRPAQDPSSQGRPATPRP